MGLPHVVVRFYTNPDGRAARRTTLVVLGLLGIFYLLPPLYGALGRVYAPELAGSGSSDALVLELPRLMLPGLGGELLTGPGDRRRVRGVPLDLVGPGHRGRGRAQPGRHRPALRRPPARWRRRLPGRAPPSPWSSPASLALSSPDVGVARTVGLAFAVAASTFCPLLLLGIWWRGLTAVGAVAGLLVGGLGSGAAVGVHPRAARRDRLGRRTPRAAGRLERPGARWSRWSSSAWLTRSRVPGHTGRFMVRLHTPEARRARPRRRPLVARIRPLTDPASPAGRGIGDAPLPDVGAAAFLP